MGKVVWIIAGPTAIGKSDLACNLARIIGVKRAELISADSVQVYRHLNIGSNKSAFSNDIKQHLVDIRNPNESFTVADYHRECWKMISKIEEPIIVGGTGLYIEWILKGRPEAPPVLDQSIKSKVEDILSNLPTWNEKIEYLNRIDSISASRIKSNDLYRLKRALEVYEATGRALSSFSRYGNILPIESRKCNLDENDKNDENNENKYKIENHEKLDEYEWRCIYLYGDRIDLARKQDIRCEKMIQKGLVQEVYDLIQKNMIKSDSSAGRAIGYSQTIEFLDKILLSNEIKGMHEENENVNENVIEMKIKEIEIEKIEKFFLKYLEEMANATRQYSRRQECWFKKLPFTWFNHDNIKSEDLAMEIWNHFQKGKNDLKKESLLSIHTFDQSSPSSPLSFNSSFTSPSITMDEKKKKEMKCYRMKLSIFKDKNYRIEFIKENILKKIT